MESSFGDFGVVEGFDEADDFVGDVIVQLD